jgi:acetyl-CoA acetyltransferase
MDVAVVGIGRTAYTRPRKTERSTLALAAEAARAAIADAGLAPADVDGLACFGVSDTSFHSQVSFAIGIDEVAWNLDVNGGGDTVCATVQAAAAAIVTGQCKVAVVFRSLNGRSGVRFGQGEGVASTLSHFEPSLDRPTGLAVPHQWMALWARRHQFVYGTTCEDFGAIAVTQRQHAVANPHAAARAPITLDDYLESKIINDPLRIYDLSLEVDGACALVLTSVERARDLRHPVVRVGDGVNSYGSGGSWNQAPDQTHMFSAGLARRLWERSGLRADEIDIACIYDCFTYTVMAVLEDLGFSEPGSVGDFYRDGRATYGGDVVVNPHGGLLSEGYLHGMNHHYEAVLQLRGEAGQRQVADARTALVTSGAGPYGGAFVYTAEA